MANKKSERAKKFRIALVIIVLLADIIFLPWILMFPQFLVKDMINAPTDWIHYGLIKSIKTILFDKRYLKLYGVLQIGIVALIIAIVWRTEGLKKKKNRIQDGVGGPEPAGDGQFGTSRWQNEEEMDKTASVWNTDMELKKGGIVLGMEKKPKKSEKEIEKIWYTSDDIHSLLIGATRSGKDRKILLPSIWEMAKSGESMVFGDPKGEMYISTKDYLKEQGYNIITLNLRDPRKGNQWNMLEMINQAIDKGDIPKGVELAWDIANTIGKQTPATSSEPIWKNGSESTIAALILLATLESEFKFQRHMTSAYYLLSEYGQPLADDTIPLIDYINKLPTRHPARAAFATASIAPYKTRASFFTNVLSELRLFSDPNISDMTSKQDHNLESIGIDKTAVFLIIPDEKNTRNVLATLYISQVYQALVDLSNKRGGRIPRRVNIILNEFGNLPALPDFPTMLTVGGGRGIRFTIAIQDVAQLKTLYKEASQTIQGNCSNWIFLKTADPETAELISKKTGKYTVETENTGSSVQNKGYSSSHGLATTGRSLLLMDEVLRWDVGESLVLPTGTFPARYPLPDLSFWDANKDFGFVEPSGDIDADKEKNRQIIEERWNNVKERELEEVQIWLPDIESNSENDKEIAATENSDDKKDIQEFIPQNENLDNVGLENILQSENIKDDSDDDNLTFL